MRKKLLTLVMPALLITLYFAVQSILMNYNQMTGFRALSSLVELAEIGDPVIEELQKERGRSAVVFASDPGSLDFDEAESALRKQREKTDARISGYNTRLSALLAESNFDRKVKAAIGAFRRGLDKLGMLRQSVDGRSIPSAESGNRYTSLITGLIDRVPLMIRHSIDPALTREITAYYSLTQAAEMAGRERATGAHFIRNGVFDLSILQKIAGLGGQQDAFVSEAISMMSSDAELRATLESQKSTAANQTLEQMRETLFSGLSGIEALDASGWFVTTTQRIGELNEIRSAILARSGSMASNGLAGARNDLVIASGIALAAILGVIVLMLFIIKAINSQVRRLLEGVQYAMESKDLTRLIEISSKDEVGDIGIAINDLFGRFGRALQQLNQIAEVFHHSRESIIIADVHGTIQDVNPAFTRITGYSRDEAIGNNPRVLKSGRQEKDFYEKLFEQLQSDGYWSGQFWNKRKSGELYLQRGTISAVFDERGQPRHYIAVMEDVSAHYEAEERINSLANFDQLTGLPNRALLLDRFNLAQSDSRRNGRDWSLMFIDLDDFKQVNDALGHRTGDQLLKGVGQRFKSLVRDTDTLCRFGGDEFIVLMSGGANEAGELARRLINEVNRIYELDGASLQVGASIGISVLFQDGDSLDELIQAADTAMYHAKAQGRGCFQFFEKNMHSRVQNRLALKHALKKAITENEFCLFYQPKVSCTPSGQHETIGFEALVRWNHPETGMVSPEDFIPAAEESGQIADIDRWVLQNAIDQLRIWLQHQPGDVVPVAINVSASLFSKDGFVDELRSLLASSGVPAHLVELEITEHVATHDMERTLETLNQLKKVGVWLAIDDFGTGYSSLSYLQRFPIDRLKIDMSFVRDVHLDHKKQGLVRAILTMAKALDLKTIAEGIEVAEELAFMSQNGCDEYQGYYFGKPVPVAEVSLPRLSPSPA